MKYVINSSVGVKWVIPEVDSAKALRLCDHYRIGVIELLAPDFDPARSPIPSPEPNDKRVSPSYPWSMMPFSCLTTRRGANSQT